MSDMVTSILIIALAIVVGLLIFDHWHERRKVKELEVELKRWWRLDKIARIRQSQQEEKK